MKSLKILKISFDYKCVFFSSNPFRCAVTSANSGINKFTSVTLRFPFNQSVPSVTNYPHINIFLITSPLHNVLQLWIISSRFYLPSILFTFLLQMILLFIWTSAGLGFKIHSLRLPSSRKRRLNLGNLKIICCANASLNPVYYYFI